MSIAKEQPKTAEEIIAELERQGFETIRRNDNRLVFHKKGNYAGRYITAKNLTLFQQLGETDIEWEDYGLKVNINKRF